MMMFVVTPSLDSIEHKFAGGKNPSVGKNVSAG
jgi:hypothetical protein